PGHYVFRIKSSNSDGVWNEKPHVIAIDILPPFWKQNWFVAIMLLAGVGFLMTAVILMQQQRYRRRMRRIEIQRRLQKERERISRDLHDNVGTQLSLISNNIEWIIQPQRKLPVDMQAEKLLSVSDNAKEVITTLRDTIWALNKEEIPLDELSDKLKSFVSRQLRTVEGISVAFDERLDHAVMLGPSEALNLFRICQEGVTNALKYSRGTEIRVAITARPGGGYEISIADNGTGFVVDDVNPESYGLANMHYRAAECGADLLIDAIPGKGTSIRILKK
ncbi:MAG: hypothetical protein EOP49_03565, partial [Sphingobacteriales bacterium]